MQLVGEVTGVGRSRKQAYFELRDGEGAVPCAIWLERPRARRPARGRPSRRRRSRDRRRPRLLPGEVYRRRPASRSAQPTCASPGRATCWHGSRPCASSCAQRVYSSSRSSSRGRCCRRRSESSPPRPVPPAATCWPDWRGAAGEGASSGPSRRCRTVAPLRRSPAAMQDLAARPEIEVIVVTRGGGSLADLWAFCDETLCRTVALLRVPVISAVGHERDSTLIDDVAAVACSTPTHAAEAAVPLDCVAARRDLERAVSSAAALGEAASGRGRVTSAALARGPARALRVSGSRSTRRSGRSAPHPSAGSTSGAPFSGGLRPSSSTAPAAGHCSEPNWRGRMRAAAAAPSSALPSAPCDGAGRRSIGLRWRCARTIRSAPSSAVSPSPRPLTGSR